MSKRRREPPRRSPRKPKYKFKNFAISDTDSDDDSVEYLGTWKNDKRAGQQKQNRSRKTQNLNLMPTITPIVSAPRGTKRLTKNINKRRKLVTIGSQTDSCAMCAHMSKSPEKFKPISVRKNVECNEDESMFHPSTSFPATTETVSTPRKLITEKNEPQSCCSSDAISKVSLIDSTNVGTDSIFAETANESFEHSDQAVPEEGDSILSVPDQLVEATVTGDHVHANGLFNVYFTEPIGLGDGVHNNPLTIPFPLNELYSIDEGDENNTEDE